VRRRRAGTAPAGGRDGDGRRTEGADLGWRRCGAGVRADRAVRSAVPRGAAGRAADAPPRDESLAFGAVELEALIAAAGRVEVSERRRVEARDLACDASGATEGSVFFCVPGRRVDGQEFAGEAVANGAVAVVVERPLAVDVPQLVVESSRGA